MVSKIRKLIEERGLTQGAVETAAHLPANRISKWAGGQGEPTARQALRLAQILGVPVGYLIDDAIDALPEPPPALSEDEQAVLELFQALELNRKEALRRLASPVPPKADEGETKPRKVPGSVREFTQGDDAEVARENRAAAEKRRAASDATRKKKAENH